MKLIRISGHARFEMKRRDIRLSAALRMVRTPGQVVPSIKGRQIFQGFLDKARCMLLRVVVKEDSHACIQDE
jgi:hypothetical protein